MANLNCAACEDLRQDAPSLIVNGFDDTMCTSLKNNTGLNPSSGNDDFTDLSNMADCLVGNMAEEVDLYEVCDWKTFMKSFIPNLWTTLKAMICSQAGLWMLINKVYGETFVRYYRDNSGGSGTTYQWDYYNTDESSKAHTLEIYMDNNVDDPGSQPADRDYIVIITHCADFHKFSKVDSTQTWYSSADERELSLIRKRQGQHPTVHKADPSGEFFRDFSWAMTTAVMVEKGAHLKFESYVDSYEAASDGWYRVHQITTTWIPATVTEEEE